HDQRGAGAPRPPAPGVVQRLAGRGEGHPVRPRAAPRARDAGRHLGGDPATEARGVDQGDRTDGAAAAADPFPEGFDAGPERADDAEPGDGDGLHAPAVLEAMQRDEVSNDAKCGARSPASRITMPKRSSIAIASSMK